MLYNQGQETNYYIIDDAEKKQCHLVLTYYNNYSSKNASNRQGKIAPPQKIRVGSSIVHTRFKYQLLHYVRVPLLLLPSHLIVHLCMYVMNVIISSNGFLHRAIVQYYTFIATYIHINICIRLKRFPRKFSNFYILSQERILTVQFRPANTAMCVSVEKLGQETFHPFSSSSSLPPPPPSPPPLVHFDTRYLLK